MQGAESASAVKVRQIPTSHFTNSRMKFKGRRGSVDYRVDSVSYTSPRWCELHAVPESGH